MEFSDVVDIVSCFNKLFLNLRKLIQFFKNYFPFSNTNLAFSDIEIFVFPIY